MNRKSDIIKPLNTEDYGPQVVKRICAKISQEFGKNVILYGFCDNMKWLYRILSEQKYNIILTDWRIKYQNFDCGGKQIISIDRIKKSNKNLIVMCLDEIDQMKDGMIYLMNKNLVNIPVIYDYSWEHDPFCHEEPFRSIAHKAQKRATSMISKNQLFDLIQIVGLTRNVPGDIIEFGSLHGGSGAVIAEAVKYFGTKPVWLFDSFKGIPKSKYGLDYRWENSFSNNSYKEVCEAFKDLPFVKIVKGNILKTYSRVKNKISFGYLASDTLESGEVLLNFMWPRLSKGGIIAICDYGSYPNCIPLTAYTDKFFQHKKDAVVYHPLNLGLYILKK